MCKIRTLFCKFIIFSVMLVFFSCSHQPVITNDDNNNNNNPNPANPVQDPEAGIQNLLNKCLVVYEESHYYYEVDSEGNRTRESFSNTIAEGTNYYLFKENMIHSFHYGSTDDQVFSKINRDGKIRVNLLEKFYTDEDEIYRSLSARVDAPIIQYQECELEYGGIDGDYILLNKYYPSMFAYGDDYVPGRNGNIYRQFEGSTWELECSYKCKIVNYYDITLDANGGEIQTPTILGLENIDMILPYSQDLGVSREGFIFEGWSTSADSKEIAYEDRGYFPNNDGITTLYAVWGYITEYTITYDSNGGSIEKDSQVYSGETIEGDIQVSLVSSDNLVIEREGFTFKGWATTSDAGVVEFTDGQKITITEDTVLYAVWSYIATYTITFNANEGIIETSSQTIQGETITGDLTRKLTNYTVLKARRSGYRFKGWAFNATSREIDYANASSITLNSDIELFAIWDKEVTYTITFAACGGEITTTTQSAAGTEDTGATVTLKTIKQLGLYRYYTGGSGKWLFKYWIVGANEGICFDGDSITITEDTTLSAYWELPEYDIVFIDGNHVYSSYTVKGYEAQITIYNNLSRSGYTFCGWKEGGSIYYGGETATIIGDCWFEAQWEENCFYVRLYHPGYSASSGEKFNAMAVSIDGNNSQGYGFNTRNGAYTSGYVKYSCFGSLSYATSFSHQDRYGNVTSITFTGSNYFNRERYYTINVADGSMWCDY